MFKKDSLIFGLLIGLLLPFLGIMIYYLTKYQGYSLGNFFRELYFMRMLPPVISLSVILNLAAFYFFLNKQKYGYTRGIILASLIYGMLLLYFKFF